MTNEDGLRKRILNLLLDSYTCPDKNDEWFERHKVTAIESLIEEEKKQAQLELLERLQGLVLKNMDYINEDYEHTHVDSCHIYKFIGREQAALTKE